MDLTKNGILFEEDLRFFMKKKMKKIGLGLVLIILPPIGLYLMFFELLKWSSLFEKDTAMILIFLILSPGAGIYFMLRGLTMRRLKIGSGTIPSPVLLGKWNIPVDDIELVSVQFISEGPVKVELDLKKYSRSTLDKHILLGYFLEKDTVGIKDAFRKLEVNTGFR